MRRLSTCGISWYLYRLTALPWYLCDCDPLETFCRQRYARVSNERRGMSPVGQIKHSNQASSIYSFASVVSIRWSQLMVLHKYNSFDLEIYTITSPIFDSSESVKYCSFHREHCRALQRWCRLRLLEPTLLQMSKHWSNLQHYFVNTETALIKRSGRVEEELYMKIIPLMDAKYSD